MLVATKIGLPLTVLVKRHGSLGFAYTREASGG